MMNARDQIRRDLIIAIEELGFPSELGILVADHLRTEKPMYRMLSYLRQMQPDNAEELVDEMLAISAEVERWREKKTAEYYNSQYNELLYYGLDDDENSE